MENNLLNNFWEKLKSKGKNSFEQIATRKGFGEGLFVAGKNDKNIVALSADLTESTQVELFKKNFPDRFFEMGVAEQNMASVASGMAAMGKIPFITSYAMFSPGRNWEQIRTTIVYNNVPVKIIGCHAGVSVGPDGGTHQALEDVAIMRAIPDTTIIIPCDALEAKKATIAIAKNNKPTYLRLFREKSPIITNEESEFEIGKANIMYESSPPAELGEITPKLGKGSKVGIIACGEMVSRALFCVPEIEKENISVGILNLHTIKPLDTQSIKNFVENYKNILTIEEHQISGGMGSAILEFLANENLLANLKINLLGVKDRFGQSGTKEELFEEYNLNEKHILKAIEKLLK